MEQMFKMGMVLFFLLLPMTASATADALDRLVINSSRENHQLLDVDNHRLLDDDVQKMNIKDIKLGRLVQRGVDAFAKKDYKTALDVFEIDAVQEYSIVQALLGDMYLFGKGVKQDKAKALILIQNSAKQNYKLGQFLLGVFYFYGDGVKQDYIKAEKLFYKAAKQGHATSQFMLGLMYEHNLGVKQDDSKALSWYRKAAKQGQEKAQSALNRMNKNANILHHSVKERQTVNCDATTKDYKINGDGTVTDKITKLMWKQCPEGLSGKFCERGTVHDYTWDGALQHTKELNRRGGFASYRDWRVANVDELQSIVQKSCGKSSVNTKIFPDTGVLLYWSSVRLENEYDGVIVWRTGATNIMSKDGKNSIRLVRYVQKERNIWLNSKLYGSDNDVASLKAVIIKRRGNGFVATIKNQFNFQCNLSFDSANNPKSLSNCHSLDAPRPVCNPDMPDSYCAKASGCFLTNQEEKNPKCFEAWEVKEPIIHLKCSTLKTEQVCSGSYTLLKGDYDSKSRMTIAHHL